LRGAPAPKQSHRLRDRAKSGWIVFISSVEAMRIHGRYDCSNEFNVERLSIATRGATNFDECEHRVPSQP
jgi:hypothetical protein